MAASDLTEILVLMAQESGQQALSEQTRPKKSEVIGWINDSNIFIASFLAPQRIDVGQWTPGRMDRLQKQQATATVNDGTGENMVGYVTPPTSPKPFCYYGEIRVQGYRATEVSLRELLDRTGGTFAATTSTPIYAWAGAVPTAGVGKLYYRPIASAAAVIMNYLTLPALMVLTSQEVYPMSKDLISISLDYGRMMINLQGAKDPERANMFLDKVMATLEQELKANQQLIEPARV